jgi:hypothetical protein
VTRLHVPSRRRDYHSAADLPALIAALASPDGVERERARGALVALGEPAVAPLVRALSDQDRQVRWEAANALACLRAPSAADALVAALGDERIGVRWLAAEGLIALGHHALEPIFKALVEPGNATSLGEGSHHVLHVLAKNKGGQWLAPVVEAIDSHESGIAVPLAAFRALEQLRTTAAGCVTGRPASESLIGKRTSH